MKNFIFVIPLKSYKFLRASSQEKICSNLNETLRSIGVSDKNSDIFNVECHICGHENPFLDFPHIFDFDKNLKVVFHLADFDRPADSSKYMLDKVRKKQFIYKEVIHQYAGVVGSGDILLMTFDADDLVSSSFFQGVGDIDLEYWDDICYMSGYAYDKTNNRVGFLDGEGRKFYRNCGSCYINKLTLEDLKYPVGIIHKFNNHVRYPDISKSLGRKVFFYYSPDLCYVVNHGENDSSLRHEENRLEAFVRKIQVVESDERLSDFKREFFNVSCEN